MKMKEELQSALAAQIRAEVCENTIMDLMKTEHEEIIFKQSGVCKMVLAYHTIGNGTTFGGIRILPSTATISAVNDALRLSEAMTYKLALVNEPFGGSKAVVLEPEGGKTEDFLHDIGGLVEQENGKFITAIDFGFEPDDAKVIRERTSNILAVKDTPFGQSGVTTAYGVLLGIQEALSYTFGNSSVEGRTVTVQGLGSVGIVLAEELLKQGAIVSVSDIDTAKVMVFSEEMRKKYGRGVGVIKKFDKFAALFSKTDVLAPCGPAYIINQDTIPKLNCKIIAGGANCQLLDETNDDRMLFERGILIAPDYAINAGGVMQGIEEFRGGELENVISRLPIISENLREIFHQSIKKGIGTYAAAKQMALDRLF